MLRLTEGYRPALLTQTHRGEPPPERGVRDDAWDGLVCDDASKHRHYLIQELEPGICARAHRSVVQRIEEPAPPRRLDDDQEQAAGAQHSEAATPDTVHSSVKVGRLDPPQVCGGLTVRAGQCSTAEPAASDEFSKGSRTEPAVPAQPLTVWRRDDDCVGEAATDDARELAGIAVEHLEAARCAGTACPIQVAALQPDEALFELDAEVLAAEVDRFHASGADPGHRVEDELAGAGVALQETSGESREHLPRVSLD